MKNFEANYGQWILRYRWLIIMACILAVLMAASGGRFLSFTNNYRVFFSEENPQLKAFDALERMYTKNDNVIFIITPKNGDVFTNETLAIVEELTAQAWQLPFSIRVDSITNFQYTSADGDDLIVQDLVEDAKNLSRREIEKVKKIALSDPVLRNRLIPKTSAVTGVNATIQLPGKDEAKEVPVVVAKAREIMNDFNKRYPNVEIRLNGMVLMNNAFSEASQQDMAQLVLPSFILMIIILGVLIRDLSKPWYSLLVLFGSLAATIFIVATYFAKAMVLVPEAISKPVTFLIIALPFAWYLLFMRLLPGTASTFLIILFSIMAALGVGGYIGFPLTPPSMSAPTIILTVAIANCVHILVTFLHEMRTGKEKNRAIIESLRVNLQPVFLASVTTAIGFLSMNFSDAPPFQHLGNFVAFGVVASFILSVTFLPAVISLLPVKVKQVATDKDLMMERFGDFVVRNSKKLMLGMGVVIIVLVSFLPKNELNDVFVEYFDKSVTFRANSDYMIKNLTGLYIIDYSLSSGEPGGISNPEYQEEVAAFAEWYRQQPETIHVNVFTDIMKRLNKNMHGDKPDWYQIPQSRELSAQYLLLYEMSLPYGLDLNNQINVDKSETRMTVTMKTVSSNHILAFEERAQQWLKANTKYITNSDGSGPTVMFAHIGKRNIVSMLTGTTIALFLISMILVFALRSFKIGFISLIPNLVPAAMGFGLWGILVGEVGLALSIVTGMTLGIVVDDTVHFLSKYLRARREKGFTSKDAVRYAFTHVGRALITTSIILVVGFSVIAQSTFVLNASMGLLTAIVIIFALAADLLFLPALLIKFEGKGK
ncbi:Predicted exporter of the RND superfamily [hydrothermal vent metagenome]|uniref:Predicted exporter of the RND superfamily n=1 Tax=hydrothermal vent metagenome TaxID=652676 RepID=A0A3B0ZTV3_9ZZZZ